MILNVLDRSGAEILGGNSLKYMHRRTYVYGVADKVSIGTPSISGLKVGEEYGLSYISGGVGRYVLNDIYPDVVGGYQVIIHEFMHKLMRDIRNDLVPVGASYFSVLFDRYVSLSGSQLDYFIDGLRRKGLILAVSSDFNIDSIHLEQRLFFGNAVDLSHYEAFVINGSNAVKRLNYCQISPVNAVSVTSKGRGFPVLRPYRLESDINGLDNYLIARKKIKTADIQVNAGDSVLHNGERYVIIEKDHVVFSGEQSIEMVLGNRA